MHGIPSSHQPERRALATARAHNPGNLPSGGLNVRPPFSGTSRVGRGYGAHRDVCRRDVHPAEARSTCHAHGHRARRVNPIDAQGPWCEASRNRWQVHDCGTVRNSCNAYRQHDGVPSKDFSTKPYCTILPWPVSPSALSSVRRRATLLRLLFRSGPVQAPSFSEGYGPKAIPVGHLGALGTTLQGQLRPPREARSDQRCSRQCESSSSGSR